MAIITGTMFLRTRIEPNSVLNGSMYMSVCFYSVMIMMFNGLTEMTIAVRRFPGARPLCIGGSKHRKLSASGILSTFWHTQYKLRAYETSLGNQWLVWPQND